MTRRNQRPPGRDPLPCVACDAVTLGRCPCGAALCGTYGRECPARDTGCPACGAKVGSGIEEWHERVRRRPGEPYDEWVERRSCLEKVAWDHTRDVAMVAMSFNRRLKDGEDRFRYYRCLFCGRYHLTRMTPERQLALRRRISERAKAPAPRVEPGGTSGPVPGTPGGHPADGGHVPAP